MPDYSFEAISATGIRSTGTVPAGNEREALAILDARGLFPVKVAAARGAINLKVGGKRVGARNMATCYSQLADLLQSGVPLLRSLEIMERQSAAPALSQILREIKAKVADGTSLADAMSEHPRAFNELACSMVKAGQEGGFLEDSLNRISAFTEQQEDLKAKVIGALVYPVFLALTGLVVLNILILFVVPNFKPIFEEMDKKGKLPIMTTYLLGFSDFMWSKGWVLFPIGFLLFIAFARWKRTERGRVIMDGLKLKIPRVGTIYQNLALSRFTRILGTLLHNGIPILQALRIGKDSTGNRVLSAAIEKAAENVTGGKSLAAPLASSKYFPKDIVEMVSVGEESNNLEKVLVNVADSLEKRTTRQLEMFVRLLEPIMLLVMAAVTLVVVAGLLLPIFNMGAVVSQN